MTPRIQVRPGCLIDAGPMDYGRTVGFTIDGMHFEASPGDVQRLIYYLEIAMGRTEDLAELVGKHRAHQMVSELNRMNAR